MLKSEGRIDRTLEKKGTKKIRINYKHKVFTKEQTRI